MPKAKEVFHRFQVHSSTIQTELTSARQASGDSDSEVESTPDTVCLLSCEKDCGEKGCCPKEPVPPSKPVDAADANTPEVVSF